MAGADKLRNRRMLRACHSVIVHRRCKMTKHLVWECVRIAWACAHRLVIIRELSAAQIGGYRALS